MSWLGRFGGNPQHNQDSMSIRRQRHACSTRNDINRLDAGLRINFVHEHREVPWQALPTMEAVGSGTRGADGAYQSNRTWRLPEAQRDLVPLMYSLLAIKPSA